MIATPPEAPGRPARLDRSTILLLGFLSLLLLTLLVGGPARVVDLVSGQPIPEARLEPIRPAVGALLEPIFGPIHAFSGLPLWRMLAALLWLGGGIFVTRLALALIARRGIRGVLAELGLFVGAYAPLAALPVVVYWSTLITKKTLQRLTPVGLPLAVYLVVLGVVLLRPSSRHRRLSLAWITTRSFVGIAGGVALGLTLLIYFVPHVVFETGERLVAPPGKVVLDLHAHGQQGDGLINSPERLLIFHRHGVQITAVTEHNYFDQEQNEKPFQTMRDLIRKNGWDMAALPGQEFTTHVCHLLLFGARKTYLPRDYRPSDFERFHDVPPTYGYDFGRLIRDVHAEGGYVVVAHWWMPWTYYRVDWRALIEIGVDGFEISSGADWAPRDLVEAWKASGQRLFAGTDFHGWHKSLYTWNLIDERVINPEGKPLSELDPWDLLRRIFESRVAVPVAAENFAADLPAGLEPPAALFRYFTRLHLGGRLMWAALAMASWGWLRFRRRRPGASPPPRPPGPETQGAGGSPGL